VVELVYTGDLKSPDRMVLRVRVPPLVLKNERCVMDNEKYILIYFIIFIGIPLLGVLAVVFDLLIG
jgi:hypothetical protein